MSAPSIDDMKLTVAKMLPDEIEIVEHRAADDDGNEASEPYKVDFRRKKNPNFYAEITDWEWLHVCWLAEQTFTADERGRYDYELTIASTHDGSISDYVWNADVKERLEALCRVKHPEMFTA